MAGSWIVYIIECADGTLYTGIAQDLAARLAAHESGKGAKYTRGRGPFKLRWSENHDTKGDALRREAEIKSLPRADKLLLKNKNAKDAK